MGRVAANKITERDETAERLIDALNHDRFVLYQQPIVPIRAGSRDIAYQEILLRFEEEEEKLLPPGTFIPILESCRLMHLLDRWVVNRVIKWIYSGHKQNSGWIAPCCSINLSSDSLTDPQFPGFVKQQLETAGIRGHNLAFEIAETDAHKHLRQMQDFAAALQPLGCRFTLTGSRGNLIGADTLPSHGIDSVKMHADIVMTLHCNPVSLQHAERLQAKCELRGVCTVGAFVEKKETLERLRALGVRYAQGHGIGHPAPLVPQLPQAAPSRIASALIE